MQEEDPVTHYKMAIQRTFHCGYYNVSRKTWISGVESGNRVFQAVVALKSFQDITIAYKQVYVLA